jgi:hypothetical protein
MTTCFFDATTNLVNGCIPGRVVGFDFDNDNKDDKDNKINEKDKDGNMVNVWVGT